MRHASTLTTGNIYGKAMADSKRDASRNVVQMVLKSNKKPEPPEKPGSDLPTGSLMGVRGR